MDRVETMYMRKLVVASRNVIRRISDDRGAILVFTALALVGFMTFSAITNESLPLAESEWADSIILVNSSCKRREPVTMPVLNL